MNRKTENIKKDSNPLSIIKKMVKDKAAIHAKIRKGESLKELTNQGIKFVTPV